MRIEVIGGGPAGLYFAILAKKAFPRASIRVHERNRADDTYGWGVVFSDETLGNFESADAATYERITASFRRWETIETHYGGEVVTSTGHGFAALARPRLLLILQERAAELGVEMRFESEVESVGGLVGPADLVVAADGVNSRVRDELAAHFRPEVDWRKCRFSWLGTDRPLSAFTFHFKPTDHGLFQVHAYPFDEELATWIVECREEAWRSAGLDRVDEAGTVAFCEELFADELAGHRLLANRSIWRRFPTVRCATWHHGNAVLLGDAAHTAHFSVGSGTKLAMEDAIALAAALEETGGDVAAALPAYEDARWVDVAKLQRAAQTSLEWFEESERWVGEPPVRFTFSLLTRSKRITYENLKRRDPELIARVDRLVAEESGAAVEEGGAPPPIFTPYRLRGLELANRVVVSPMCQYSAEGGTVGDWHLVHLGSRAVGGAGLVMTEMTDVEPEGRITLGCAGLWCDRHTAAWRRIVDFVHAESGAAVGIQLAHAGRKGSVRHPWEGEDVPLPPAEGGWRTLAPSALPFRPDWPVPREMDDADLERVRDAFVAAAQRAEEAGFDLLELHLAHGYLLSSFLTPLANRRRDEYGGDLAGRARFPLEVVRAVRGAWPDEKPLAARISATDWMPDGSGMTGDDAVTLAGWLAGAGCDVVDVSSAGNVPESRPDYGRMYQVPFADRIRHEAGVPVIAVGAILGADHANTVVAAGRADLAAMARPHLRDPYLTLHAAERYELWDHPWPDPYLPARPREPKPPRRRDR